MNRRQMILAAGASMATLASRPTFASPELTEHEGFVASRARLVYSMTEAYKQIMSRSCHFANEDLKSIKLIFTNFRPGGAGDLRTGSAATISASIEFPAGTVTPIYFQGERIGSVADVGSITSDYAAVSIPNGSPFWVRLFYTSRSAIIFNLCNSYLGEQSRVGTGELTDQTSTGDVLYGGTPQNWILPPSAIIGKTKKQSVLIVGDSRSKGQGDKENASNTTLGRDGKVGNIARSMGVVPFVNISAAGESAGRFLSAKSRMVFLPYASQIIVSYGINDVAQGSAYDAIRAIQSIWRAAGAQKKYCITIEPYSTSVSKNWTVAPGDQVNAAKNRIAFNNLVRSGIPGGTGYYEVADVVESSRDSGLWAGASPPNTLDGLHPSESGYALIASSGAVRLG